MRKVLTHSNAFNWKTIIYAVGDISLPFPLPIGFLAYFAVAELLMVFLGICGLVIYNGLVHYLLIPILLTYLLADINPEDKGSLKWIWDFIRHKTSDPKEQWNFQKPEKHEEGHFNSISYRK